MVQGKTKGNSFEIETGKALSNWLTQGRDAKQLLRTLGSGGQFLRMQDSSEPWNHVGDLASNGPEAREFRKWFAVECKHHAVIDLWLEFSCRTEKGSILAQWWAKIKEECAPYNLHPMLVMRMNRKPTMVCLPAGFSQYSIFQAGKTMTLPHLQMLLLPFADFLELDPKEVRRVAVYVSPRA